MNTDVIAECMKLSFANTPFPLIAQRLAGAGVRAYTADLMQLRKTYYGSGRESYDEPLALANGPAIAAHFDPVDVATSLRAIQKGEIGYEQFLHRIMAAGCAHYEVFLDGRKAMYFGRDGDFHTEHFPPPAS
jgi:uncharacterized protein YbcV (DUF1398 family)